MKGIIYKATNTFNGKVYIGQTVAGLPKRKQQHMKDAKADDANSFHVALYQYPNAFEWEVIDSFSGTREQVIHALNVAEEYHILVSNSTDPRYGYNSTQGGYSSDKFAEQIRLRAKAFGGSAKQLLQYDRHGNFIREFASLNEVSAFLKRDKVSPKDLITGLHYGCQWRLKENEYFPRKINAYVPPPAITHKTAVAVYRNDGLLVGEYESIKEALAATKQKSARIRNNIGDLQLRKHQTREFYFFRLGDDPAPNTIIVSILEKKEQTKINTPTNVPVLAYDAKTGALLKEYPSMSDAHKHSGAADSTIRYYLLREEPFKVNSPHTKYIWVRKTDTVKPSVTVIPFIKQEPRQKMEHRIIQYSLQGQFIKVWENANLAANSGEDNHSAIYNSLKGKQGKKTNFIWRYYSDNAPEQIPTDNRINTTHSQRTDDTILELNKAGEITATYKNTAEAAEKSGFSQAYICNVLAGRIKHPKRRFKRP